LALQISGTRLLLHLSDIHFREPYCLKPETDQDRPVRQALIYDIRNMIEKLGPVDAILVSGDIAFKGHSQEYEVATQWLFEVAGAAGCKQNSIYTVPGNHDVVRNIAGSRLVQGVRRLITHHQPGAERDRDLHDAFLDKESAEALISPMTQYNLFAAGFRCDLTPELPFWIQELPLAPGWTLNMHGLTTTFFSGPGDDARGGLYLGALQRVFTPIDGVVYLAVLHHPPDWLADHDQVEDALWDSCSLHLLAHKHSQRYHADTNAVRLAASAVNPSRTEQNWEPGYNLVRLQIIDEEEQYSLRIESHLRRWQYNPDRFVAKRTGDDKDVFVHTIPLGRRPSSSRVKDTKENPVVGGNPNEPSIPDNEPKTLAATIHERDLVFEFWQLLPSQRRQIALDLNLLEPGDNQLPEPQRYRLAFERARERKLIDKLEDEINQQLARK